MVLDGGFGGASRNRTGVNGFAGRCITTLLSRLCRLETKTGKAYAFPVSNAGAGNESRTRDLQLGKLSLYQVSYFRKIMNIL